MGSFGNPVMSTDNAFDNADYRKPHQQEDGRLQATSPSSSTSIVGPEKMLVEAIIRRGDSPHTRRAYTLDLRTYWAWLDIDGHSVA